MEENKEKLEVGKIFTVLGENDQEQEMKVVGFLKLEEMNYAAVIFVEDTQEETMEDISIFFLRVEDDNALSMIESEEEFEKVSAAYNKLDDKKPTKKRGKNRNKK
ncbi:DUF1292 domain-containing protein [Psychrobacillus glaciei]|uniref:DUF1292 domain-containing protein n=1 Tax=Psychrobacillus glaciei TaxID=2283160 RepID=A0A5J6SQZ0_9BACI|nr:DUF1292 domain-containing protein [Psychrobacillus glaciei]QFG00419.1 DUF1292 domain-containing protein [Psychrobacillus glaciei]